MRRERIRAVRTARIAARRAAPVALAGDRFVIALLVTLAALAVARAAASLSSGMWMWGLVAMRHLPPLTGWWLWLALPLALLPSLGGKLGAWSERIGDAMTRRPGLAGAIGALTSAALVWALPDRTLFLGDFAMRSGTILTGSDPGRLFPQAMVLDVLVHVRLPEFLIAKAGWTVPNALRTLGAIGAALLAVAALRLPRSLALRGGAALAAAVILWGGGYLGMFTGYGKSAIEMTALTALAGTAALSAVREGRSLVTLGLAVSLALGFHRSGLLLVPLALVGFVLAPGAWRLPTRWIGLALVAGSLATFGPRAIELITTFDVQHHLLPAEKHGLGGMFAALLDPLHLLDVLNVTLMLSPLVPTLLAIGLAQRPAGAEVPPAHQTRRARIGHALSLTTLVLPALALLLITRPQQGVFRDRDVFAPAAVALSLLVASRLGGALRAVPSRAWLVPALALGTIVPSVQWLVLMHSPPEGLRYVADYVQGPPQRSAWDRAATWDFLGTRALVDRRYDASADAYAKAVEAAQNPRLIGEWGMADLMRGDYARAESLFQRAVTLDPHSTVGWKGLAAAGSYLGDTAACAKSEANLARMDPQNPYLPELRAFLARARAGH